MYYHSMMEKGYRFYWRGWFRFGPQDRFGLEGDLILADKRPSFGLYIERTGHGICFHLALPWALQIWFKIKGILPHGNRRQLGFTVHGGSIWFNLWVEPMDGKFVVWHLTDWVTGRAKYSEVTLEERDILVPMPERSYAGTARLFESTWKYPRWFSKTMKRCEIKIPEGIPHEGKGENSWDCGIDGTFGMTTGAVSSIPEAVGNLVGMCLKDRVKYGGWGDYEWKKPGLQAAA